MKRTTYRKDRKSRKIIRYMQTL